MLKGVTIIKDNVVYDLGNIWEMLSAIGTLFAVIISLWLARRSERKVIKIKASITESIPDNFETRHLDVNILNSGKKRVKIEEIGIVQKGKKKVIRNLFTHIKYSKPFFLDEIDNAKISAHEKKVKTMMEKNQFSSKYYRVFAKDNTGKMYYSKKMKIL